MPPKIRVTKESVIDAALDIACKHGAQAVNARTVAAALGCSTQPVFSNFTTMEALHKAVAEKAEELYRSYLRQEVEKREYPAYKASGMAYIRFAKEERELFKLLFMCDRSPEAMSESSPLFDDMKQFVQKHMGLEERAAELFHLEMWAYVHGIATMFATGFLDLPWELVSHMLTDSYQGLRMRYNME